MFDDKVNGPLLVVGFVLAMLGTFCFLTARGDKKLFRFGIGSMILGYGLMFMS